MSDKISIFWFRQDLRLSDNPALSRAVRMGLVIPVFILDESTRRQQAASDWWLHHSLKALNKSLEGSLHFYRGDPARVLPDLARKTGAQIVAFSRAYTPAELRKERTVQALLQEKGIEVINDNASLLWAPGEVLKADGTPYRVFTPFYKRCISHPAPPRTPLPAPKLRLAEAPAGLALEELQLLPRIRWDKKLEKYWEIGEQAAREKSHFFIANKISAYKDKRDYPALGHTSRLSPHLHFGEISPHQIWHEALKAKKSPGRDHFLTELGWREFAHMLLYYFPETETEALNKRFDNFTWRDDKDALSAWQKGQTGIPIIDAGMRELWETGVMHNRVRMIVASFLVKNLLVHWQEGEAWFFDCLVDADLANNVAGWQWVAGSGADAAPYFRIFNPVTQAKKFDREGVYIRRFVPEIADLPNRFIHCPWQADQDTLEMCHIELGTTYPHPVVDLKTSRQLALEFYKKSIL